MARLRIRPISIVTYDPENNAIRTYYDRGGVDPMKGVPAATVAKQFLQDNLLEFKFDLDKLVQVEVRNASGYQSVRYLQHLKNVPVYGAEVVVNVVREQGNILGFYNNFDYAIPDTFKTKPARTEKYAREVANKALSSVFEKVGIKDARLFIYRHKIMPGDIQTVAEIGKRPDATRIRVLRRIPVEIPKEGQLFLVWRIIADVQLPLNTSLELLVDANAGNLIVVRDRSDYVNGTGKVFLPDPVTSSGSSLCTSTPGSISPASTFDPLRTDVVLQGLDPADAAGNYHLTGAFCRIQDWDTPTCPPPSENTPDFNYSTSNRNFLAVMAYYWIDTVQRYIQNDLGVSNAGDYQIEADPQGYNGLDNSSFSPGTSPGDGRLTFGEGGAPDASDAAVILHEYGHAIHDDQVFTGTGDLKEGFADLFARIYLDRFNPNQFRREQVFPWDNNPDCGYAWGAKRRVDLSETYANFSASDFYLNGDIWATTVWQIYLALGGAATYQSKRNWAADLCLKLHLEGNVGYSSTTAPSAAAYANHQRIALALEGANNALNNWRSISNGLFDKVIRDRCIIRGLLNPLSVDVYIDDGRNGGYDYREVFWDTQDIVVRRKSTDSPTLGYQEPVVNQSNYLWVKVKRKGAGSPGVVNVKAFHCNPGTGLMWPTDWTAMSPASISATTLGTTTEEWVGPFEWTPPVVGHECALAIVEAANDPANTQGLVGTAEVWMLVPFDNNIAQRNLSPVPGGSGKQERQFRLINPTERIVTIELEVEHDLPRGWELEFDVPDIKNIPLPPYRERWVTLRVNVPAGLEFRSISERARVTITSLRNGIPDGGMTFDFVHPSLYAPPVKPPEKPPLVVSTICECLQKILEGAEVKVEIRFKDPK